MSDQEARQALTLALVALRQRLRQRHGATHLDVRIEALDSDRVVLAGSMLVESLRGAVANAVVEVLGRGVHVDLSGLEVVTEGAWFTVPHGGPLLDGCGAEAKLSTELPPDTRVQRFGGTAGQSLVRAVDGTVGWIAGQLRAAPAPKLAPPKRSAPEALAAEAVTYLGTPYRLGGSTREAIDCSALVARAALDGLGIVVPRHTRDQLGLCPRDGAPPEGDGHLLFVWTASEALCHVGITEGGHVVHASLSRRRVVRDARIDLLGASRRTHHVRFVDLLAYGNRVAGAASLVAAGIVPGRARAAEEAEPCGTELSAAGQSDESAEDPVAARLRDR